MIGLFARLNLWHSHVDCVQLYLRFVVYYVGGSLRRVPLLGHFTDVCKQQHPVNTEVLWGDGVWWGTTGRRLLRPTDSTS
jgi:hypothetical protein